MGARLRLILVVALLQLGSACSHNPYSPPIRSLPLESSAALPPNATAVRLSGGTYGALFGPELAVEASQVRRGLLPNLEGAADLYVAQVLDDSAADTSRNIYALRAGCKWSPPRARGWIALTGGLGGGVSAGGPFAAGDLGLVLATENPYVVPFLAGQLLGSVPLASRAVDVSHLGEDPGSFVVRPLRTWGYELSLGLKVVTRPVRLLFGLTFLSLHNARGEDGFLGLGGGLEFPL